MRTTLLTLSISSAVAATALAQDKSKAIEATDAEALKAAIEKTVTVSGTLESVTYEGKKTPVELKFIDSPLKVWASAATYWKDGGWGMEALIDKQLYFHGKVQKRSSTDGVKIELLGESYFHNELDSLLASLPKPAPKPGEKPAKEEPVKYELVSAGAIFPVNPGPKSFLPERDTAALKVILPKFAGSQPEMIVTDVTAEIMNEPKSGPMQATFELKPKLSIKPMISVMTYLPKKYKDKGWPMHKTAHFIIDDIQADSAPTNFAAAVMLESMLSGTEIPENVVLFGGLTATGEISRAGDKTRSDASYMEAVKLAASAALPPVDEEEEEEGKKKRRSSFAPKSPKPEKTMYLITGNVPDATIDDLIIDEDWETLSSTIVLRCKNFDEAMTLIRGIGEGNEVGKSITDFAEAQKLLRDKSIRMLANKSVWARVVAAGKAFEGNATAFGYARMRTRKVSESYSLDRCLAHVSKTVKSARAHGLDKLSERDLRKYTRDIATKAKEIEPKIHPDAAPVLAAGLVYLGELVNRTEALKKAQSKVKDNKEKKKVKVPEREEAKYKAAKKTYEEAVAAAKAKLG